MALVFDQLGAARDQMERVKGLVAQVGLRYDDLLAVPVGVGIGVAFDEARFLVLSVLGGGSESQLLLTAGVAHDIVDDRLAGLEFCNGHTCANAAFPCVLHRADDGTDILVQQRYPSRCSSGRPTTSPRCSTCSRPTPSKCGPTWRPRRRSAARATAGPRTRTACSAAACSSPALSPNGDSPRM